MATGNELLLDATIRHQIKLLRFSHGQAEDVARLLMESDEELTKLLQSSDLTEASEARLRAILADVRKLRTAAVERVAEQMAPDLSALADTEANWEVEAIAATSPVQLSLSLPPPSVLKTVVGRPINGVPLKNWLGTMAEGDISRIEQQIRLGVVQGEPLDQIVRRIRGTKANGYADGVTAITRRNAQTIARTAVNHVSNVARHEVWHANADIIQGIRWVATLDGRTSPVCRGRDGEVYPINEGPRPPAHPGCRSTTTAVLAGERIVGDRPMVKDSRTRQTREKDFRAEAKAEAGEEAWKNMTVAERNALVKGRREKWTAENVGTVPNTTTYDSWLRKQPREFQDEVLGKSKADLFRGGATLDKFIDEKGKPYTLAQLQAETAGDKLHVVQPGVGMKAKALLQQGLSNQEVVDAIKAEFPDASTTVASVSSYKVELKKAGLLDQSVNKMPQGGIKQAKVVADVVDNLDKNLPEGLRHTIGGQWATVVEDLDGVPGAYGYYQAGKGVMLSGKKLSAISIQQAQQVVAHELGHLLHKQHNLVLDKPDTDKAILKEATAALSPDGKKMYGYYLSSTDELIAEINAQALSPSPLTSQGLSAIEFNKVFGAQIDLAKANIQAKFPTPPKNAPPPLPGGPTTPFEVAGKHKTVGSLAKALLQQGLPDDQVLAAVKLEFPDAKTSKASLAFYKVELKKQGQLAGVGQSGPVLTVKAVPDVAPVPPTPESVVSAPTLAASTPSNVLLSGSKLKELGIEMMEQGILDSKTIAEALKKQYPANANKIKVENIASWKTNWKKASPEKFAAAEKKAKVAMKAADQAGPLAKPKLYGKNLGNHSTAGLVKLKTYLAGGGDTEGAVKLLTQHFGLYNSEAGSDLIELAKYELATGKAAIKPYLNAIHQPYAGSKAESSPKQTVDLTPARVAMSPREAIPPPPRFTAQQRRAAVEAIARRVDTSRLAAMNDIQKQQGLPEITEEEAAAIRAYTGGVYNQINRDLREGKFINRQDLQAFVEAAQHGLSKMPKYQGLTSRGLRLEKQDLEQALSVYRPGAAVEENAFVSTSYGESAAFKGNVYMKIQSKRGVNVEQISLNPSEREVLYMPGTQFKVLRITNDSGAYIIHMEEI